jgi:preprotein translocase SecF subunit
VQVQNFGTSHDVLIRLPVRGNMKQASGGAVFASCARPKAARSAPSSTPRRRASRSAGRLCSGGGAEPVKLSRTEFVGPSVGSNWRATARWRWPSSVLGIMIYLAFRFEWKFAVAGIIANLHDVVIILGFFAFFQWEFSLAVLAAVLAVLGYSVNESVVIFDRIREAFRKYRKLTTPQVIDHAITSTISRTIITHGSDADDGAVDADLRRPHAALLCRGADHRHPVRHLLVDLRGRRHRDVAGRQARGPGQGLRQGARPERSQRRGGGVESFDRQEPNRPSTRHGDQRRPSRNSPPGAAPVRRGTGQGPGGLVQARSKARVN